MTMFQAFKWALFVVSVAAGITAALVSTPEDGIATAGQLAIIGGVLLVAAISIGIYIASSHSESKSLRAMGWIAAFVALACGCAAILTRTDASMPANFALLAGLSFGTLLTIIFFSEMD